jgi:hypothetical protein
MGMQNESPPQELAADGLGAPEWTWNSTTIRPQYILALSVRQAQKRNPLRLREAVGWRGTVPNRGQGAHGVVVGLPFDSANRRCRDSSSPPFSPSLPVRVRKVQTSRGELSVGWPAEQILVTQPTCVRETSAPLNFPPRMRGESIRSGHREPRRLVLWSSGAKASLGGRLGLAWTATTRPRGALESGTGRAVPLSQSAVALWRVSSRGLTGPALTLNAGRMALGGGLVQRGRRSKQRLTGNRPRAGQKLARGPSFFLSQPRNRDRHERREVQRREWGWPMRAQALPGIKGVAPPFDSAGRRCADASFFPLSFSLCLWASRHVRGGRDALSYPYRSSWARSPLDVAPRRPLLTDRGNG